MSQKRIDQPDILKDSTFYSRPHAARHALRGNENNVERLNVQPANVLLPKRR